MIDVVDRPEPRMIYPPLGRPYWGPSPRQYEAKPRVYVFVEGENMISNLENRFRRPYEAYKRFLPKVLEALGNPEGVTFRWSQKAGCSCGCSPAFIVSGLPGRRIDVLITITGAKQLVANPVFAPRDISGAFPVPFGADDYAKVL